MESREQGHLPASNTQVISRQVSPEFKTEEIFISNGKPSVKFSAITETILAVDANPHNRPKVLYNNKDIFNVSTSTDLSAIVLEKWNVTFKPYVDDLGFVEKCSWKDPRHALNSKNMYVNGLFSLTKKLPAFELKKRLEARSNNIDSSSDVALNCLTYSKSNSSPFHPKRIPLKQETTDLVDSPNFGAYVSQSFQTPLGSISIKVRFRHNCNFQISTKTVHESLPLLNYHSLNSTSFVIVNLTEKTNPASQQHEFCKTKSTTQSCSVKQLHFEQPIEQISLLKKTNGDTKNPLFVSSNLFPTAPIKSVLLIANSTKKYHSSFKRQKSFHGRIPPPQRLKNYSSSSLSHSMFKIHWDDDKDLTNFINNVSSVVLKSVPSGSSSSPETSDVMMKSFKLLDSYGSLQESGFFDFLK